jgi:hypothetical protein
MISPMMKVHAKIIKKEKFLKKTFWRRRARRTVNTVSTTATSKIRYEWGPVRGLPKMSLKGHDI